MQWPQFVLFVQDFELIPTLASWQQLARWFCFVGTCVVPEEWHRPESHGVTLQQFERLLGWCALEQPDFAVSADEPPGSPTRAPAYIKAKALFSHLFRSKGAQRCDLGSQ